MVRYLVVEDLVELHKYAELQCTVQESVSRCISVQSFTRVPLPAQCSTALLVCECALRIMAVRGFVSVKSYDG